ncbi:MAG: T9SS type A sorting domain-containing protein, partial [Bacteroidetes bacterium]|nr:T9SS type A sorting domain-containing protein [Bacteroidota bacterium]
NISVGGVFQNNSGTVALGSGTLSVTGVMQLNTGTVTGGTGAITVTGVFQNNAATFTGGSGSITFNGGYTNSGTFTAGSGTIYFGGTSQTLQDNSAAGTTFNNVTFNGSGTATIGAGVGNFSVAATGVLTMVSPAKLVAGSAATGYLTLKSSATSSATVAAISGTSSITGVVNVQRYLTGGSLTYRGYRLMSSPVYASTVAPNNVFSINYLKTSAYISGSTGTTGGFDKTGNPTLYLYRENLAPGSTFTTGNFRGINNITASPGYQLDNETGTFNIPAGNGFLFYFRGNRSTSLTSKTAQPYTAPENTTFTASGTLNQGQITVHDWYTPASGNLGYTVLTGNSAVRGFNLAGNPYASSINWDLLNNTTTTSGIYGSAVGNTIYVLDPVSRNYGAYTKGTGGIGTHNTSNILPSGQGFFVLATSATAQLIFNESAKVNTQVSGTNLLMGKPVDYASIQYIHLLLAKDSVNTDDIIVRFTNNAVSKYDPEVDGEYKSGQGVVSLASLSSDSVKLAINTQPLPETSEIIPLVASEAADGPYQFQMESIVGVPALFSVLLIDNYTKDTVDMRENPVYSFQVVHADSNSVNAKRFSLLIGQNIAYAYRLLNFHAKEYASLNQVVLDWKTKNEQDYTLFTVERSSDGQNFDTVVGSMRSDAQGTYSLPDRYPQNGINFYRLKQVDINGNMTYSKVVQIEYAQPSVSLTDDNLNVYPNPAASNINVNIKNPLGGQSATYQIRISNSVGIVVKDIKSPQPNWQGNVSDLLTGTYMIEVVNAKDQSLVGKTKFVKL